MNLKYKLCVLIILCITCIGAVSALNDANDNSDLDATNVSIENNGEISTDAIVYTSNLDNNFKSNLKDDDSRNNLNNDSNGTVTVTTDTGGMRNISLSDGYNGYCIDMKLHESKPGQEFTVTDTSAIVSHIYNSSVGEYIKILFYNYYFDVCHDKEATSDIIWTFTDKYYKDSSDPYVLAILDDYEEGLRVQDHGSVKKINDTHEMVFDFETLISSSDSIQNYFGYKVSINEISNSNGSDNDANITDDDKNNSDNGTNETETNLDNTTDNGTNNDTENSTDNSTDNGTNNDTENSTENGTDNSTDDSAENGTDDSTDDSAENGTENSTDNSVDNGTENSTDNSVDNGTGNGTDNDTVDFVDNTTEDSNSTNNGSDEFNTVANSTENLTDVTDINLDNTTDISTVNDTENMVDNDENSSIETAESNSKEDNAADETVSMNSEDDRSDDYNNNSFVAKERYYKNDALSNIVAGNPLFILVFSLVLLGFIPFKKDK